MSRPRLLFVVVAALAVLAAPAVSGAGSSPRSTSALRAHDAALATKSRAAVLSLYALDAQLSTERAKLTTLQSQLQTLNRQRASLRKMLHIARSNTRIAQARVAQRLRQLYATGGVEPLEVLLGSRSLEDALAGLDNIDGVAKQDAAILSRVKLARARYAQTSRNLAARASQVAAAVRTAAATTTSLAQARADRSAYISSLAGQRRLTERQISAALARAHEAEVRSARLAQERAAMVSSIHTVGASPSPALPTTGRVLTVVATGYSLGGTTSTGLPVGWGVAAVDPSIIPLGTRITVPGYGTAVASDTGPAIVGDTIDLWFPTVRQANAWGRRVVTIVIG
jgi:3D (Asp-Asp-Asp) domain-containing protein/peptidoglycan hydrolase CwlO-like protein